MTNDLISRSKVEEVISALVHEEGVTDDAAVLGCMVWNAVHTMEAVDAAPVVHGRRTHKTIWHTPGWGEIITEYGCCGFQERGKTNHNYCPNCGARMDKEE